MDLEIQTSRVVMVTRKARHGARVMAHMTLRMPNWTQARRVEIEKRIRELSGSEISFGVSADLVDGADFMFQSLEMKGRLVIEVWPCFLGSYFLSHRSIANPRRPKYPPKISNVLLSVYGPRGFQQATRRSHDTARFLLYTVADVTKIQPRTTSNLKTMN